MLAQIIRVMTTHPALIIDYVGGYADLIQVEALAYKRHLQKQLYLSLAFAALSLMSILVSAFGLMLWGALNHQTWLLTTVPILLILASLIAFQQLAGSQTHRPFAQIRQQALADTVMIKNILATDGSAT